MSPTLLKLTWSAVTGAVGYHVFRNTVPITRTPVTETNFPDPGLAPKASYSYAVAAVFPDPASQSPGVSAAVSVSMPPAVPPPSISARVVAPGTIAVSWTQAPDATAYLLWRDGTDTKTPIRVATTSYTDLGLESGIHAYKVASYYSVAGLGEVEGDLQNLPSTQIVLSRCSAP